MKAVLSAIRRLLNLGVANLGEPMGRKIHAMNWLNFMISGMSLCYATLLACEGHLVVAAFILGVALAGISFIVLNALGLYSVSRLGMVTGYNAATFAFASMLGEHAGIQFSFFLMICLPLVIFERQGRVNTLSIAYGLVLPVAMHALLGMTGFALLPHAPASPWLLNALYWCEVYSTSMLLGAAILHLYHTNERAEERLRKEKDFRDAILDTTSALIVVTRLDGSFVRVNRAFERLTGYSSEEIIEQGRVEDIFDPRDFEIATRGKQALVAGGGTVSIENFLRTKDGEARFIEWNGTAVRGPTGEIEHLLGTGIDVTEKRAVESKLATASKMSSLGEMASGIAHEMNNPLAVVQLRAGQLCMLADQGDVPAGRALEIGTKIEAMVERVSKIVSSLRTFAREGSRDPYARVPLETLVEDVLSFCRERFRHHGVELRVEIPEHAPSIECQAVPISQILLNLLNNAFDAALEGTGPRWVRLGAIDSEPDLVLVVEDSGAGIAAQDRRRLFEPFFTTKPLGKGTGLGLSISRAIAENHGGALELDTSAAQTRFVLRLPKRGAQDEASANRLPENMEATC